MMVQFWGCSRTASKAYMYLLNKHTNINVSQELHVLPFIFKWQFFLTFLKYFFHRDKKKFANELNDISDATYWEANEFDEKKFYRIISSQQKISFTDSVKAVLKADAQNKKKEIPGAKFISHILYFPIFIRVFTDSKFILLARDPVQIYRSQINKDTHSVDGMLKRALMIVWVSIMFNFTMFYHFLYQKRENVMFIRYKDFKSNKKEVVKKLCDFLAISFKEELLKLPRKDSSFEDKEIVKEVKLLEKKIIKTFTYLGFKAYYRANLI